MNDGLPDAAPMWAAVTGVFGAALGSFGLWLANRMLGGGGRNHTEQQ